MPEIGRSCFATEAARGVIPDFGPKSEFAEAIFVRFEVNRGCLNRLSENKFSITPVFSYICIREDGKRFGPVRRSGRIRILAEYSIC